MPENFALREMVEIHHVNLRSSKKRRQRLHGWKHCNIYVLYQTSLASWIGISMINVDLFLL